MNYFAIAKQEAKGCPVGLLDVVLLDRYHDPESLSRLDYGHFPWYANPAQGLPHVRFPKDMVLISRHPDWLDFEIRSHSKFFHLVSQDMMAVASELNAGLKDFAPVKVLRPDGSPGAARDYFVVKFDEIDLATALDLEKTLFFPFKSAVNSKKIKRYAFRDDFDCDFFQLRGMHYGHQHVYGSERFWQRLQSKDFRGIEWVAVDAKASGAFSEV